MTWLFFLCWRVFVCVLVALSVCVLSVNYCVILSGFILVCFCDCGWCVILVNVFVCCVWCVE